MAQDSQYDFENTNYTLDKVNDDGSLCVTFGVDGQQQCLAGDLPPLDDVEAVKQYLSDKTRAYISGLNAAQVASAKPNVSKDLKALIGQEQTAQEPVQPEQTADRTATESNTETGDREG